MAAPSQECMRVGTELRMVSPDPKEGTKGPHFHWGEGPGLQDHHLPWEAGDWFSNLLDLARRGAAGEDLMNLGKLILGGGLVAGGGSNSTCGCRR